MPEENKSNVDAWLDEQTDHKQTALENASKYFDTDDSLTAHTLEAIYGQESSFGKDRRSRGMNGAAGDFQMEKATAKRMGLTVTKENDQRFDIDDASAAEAKYLKKIDAFFSNETKLIKGLSTVPVTDFNERKKFDIAALNAGEGRIARAQQAAKKAGEDPTKWKNVEKYLEEAGATQEKANEIRDFVKKVIGYEKEFSQKSPLNKDAKHGKPSPIKAKSKKGHWITKNGKPIFIED